MSSILVVGNTSPEIVLEDLAVKVPFRAQVQFTLNQYHRSQDLQDAIRTQAVRVVYGVSTPPTLKVPPAVEKPVPPPVLVAEGVARGHDGPQALQALLEAQQKQLEVQAQQVRAVTEQLEQLKGLAAQLEGLAPALLGLQAGIGVASLTPRPSSQAPIEPSIEEAAVFIPTPKAMQVAASQVEVEERSVGDVSQAVQALKQKRKG